MTSKLTILSFKKLLDVITYEDKCKLIDELINEYGNLSIFERDDGFVNFDYLGCSFYIDFNNVSLDEISAFIEAYFYNKTYSLTIIYQEANDLDIAIDENKNCNIFSEYSILDLKLKHNATKQLIEIFIKMRDKFNDLKK